MPSSRRSSILALTAPAVAVVLALGGCGTDSETGTSAPPTASTVAASAAPVLSTAAVPGLVATTRAVSVALLQKDAAVPGLDARLATDGFLGGREREFQGPSKDLTHVVSRSLVFAAPSGAADFVQLVHDQATVYFGVGTQVAPLQTDVGAGWLFHPPACACHLANPLLLGVVQDGARVVWLGIDGPRATDQRLTALMAPDQSTTT